MSASTIDEKIVEMTFKGQSFTDGVKSTVAALSSLKDRLNSLKGSENSINNLDEAGKKFSLSGMANGVDQVASHFSLLGLAGLSALGTIVSKATSAGISLVKSLTIDPIKAGLDVYETKINAIQTILANTSSEGTKLSDVTAALNQLNTYANQTVYNFGQMAQNIGTFTAAGVDLKTSVASIKGIANLAALSGSSSEQASTAMYQLSQAIASGSVKLQDWNSVVNAGLGGKVFQNALEQTARATGVNIDAIIKKAGSFRNSLQQGWLSSKILTQTLSTFTGDLSAQQLKSMGYSQQQVKLILQQATAAKNSATQIRTITQLQAALREEVATAWSTVWQSLIGNIGQATSLLTAVHNTLETLFTKPVYDFNKLLTQWDSLGGRSQVIAAITVSFSTLGKILGVIGSAFREVFPPVTAETLIKIGAALDNFVAKLVPTQKTLTELRAVFVGVFSVVKIVVDVISAFVGSLLTIGSSAGSAAPGLLSLAAKFGTFLSKVQNVVASSQGIKTFFNVLTADIAIAVNSLGSLVGVTSNIGPAVSGVASKIQPIISKIAGVFSKLGDAIALSITSGNFQVVVAAINGLLLTRVLYVIKDFFLKFGKESKSGSGLLDEIKEAFGGLTGALKNMQTVLKAKTLDEIASAVGILTLSMFALSQLNVKDLSKSLSAITIMMTQLITALAVVSKVSGSTGIVKMVAIGVALNLLASAILILAGAVAILSRFSWEQLEKGLGAIAILLVELVAATLVLSTNTKGLVASAYALEVMAVAMNILSIAVGRLGALKFDTLAKGIGSVAVLLLLMVGFQKFSGGEELIATAAAMILIGAALNIMASAVASLGKMSTGSLVKGIASIAAILAILVIAMYAMEGSILGAAALVIAAAAILILANALNSLGGMSWGEIAKALVVLAGALVLLAAASIVMEASLPGAAALLVMAAALAILTPVLIAFSQMSWEGIAKALVTLAGAFIVIGAAGIALAPLAVVLLAIGAGILVLGIGITVAGVGLTLFATGLGLLAVAIVALAAAMVTFQTAIVGIQGSTVVVFANIIVGMANAITKTAPAIMVALATLLLAILGAIDAVIPKAAIVFGNILVAILNTIVKYAPKIINTFYSLVLDVLNAIAKYYPKFVSAGIDLIVNMLNGIARQIPRVASAAVNVIIAFINAVGNSELRIAQAGVSMVINLVNGIANAIRSDTARMRSAGENLASAIIDGMTLGVSGGAGSVLSAIESVAKSAINRAKKALGSNSPSKEFENVYYSTGQGAAVGIQKSASIVASAASDMGTQALSSTQKALGALGDAVSNNINVNPTITPVLDLTQAKAGFDQLNGMSKSQLIDATTSASQATSISAQNAAAANAAGLPTGGGNTTNYTQNNYSPTALDPTTIYRRTKNQLSVTKGALAGANSG